MNKSINQGFATMIMISVILLVVSVTYISLESQSKVSGAPVRVITGESETESLFDNGEEESTTMDSRGDETVKTVYIHAGTLLASKTDKDEDLSFYIQDHLGSNQKVIDGSVEAQQNKYYAFGETETTGSYDNDYKYTGKELDSETNLYYYGARYYDADLGRFVQADIETGSIKDPPSLNRYAYVKNNPLTYVDPSGNDEIRATTYNILGQEINSFSGEDAVTVNTKSRDGQDVASGVMLVLVENQDTGERLTDKIVVLEGDMMNKISNGAPMQSFTYTPEVMDNMNGQNQEETDTEDTGEDQETEPEEGSVTLKWTAPGDDANRGTAAQYDLRYSTEPITEENWNQATPVLGMPKPQQAGTKESVTVTGLKKGVEYYFRIKTKDEMSNWAALSNQAQKRAK